MDALWYFTHPNYYFENTCCICFTRQKMKPTHCPLCGYEITVIAMQQDFSIKEPDAHPPPQEEKSPTRYCVCNIPSKEYPQLEDVLSHFKGRVGITVRYLGGE